MDAQNAGGIQTTGFVISVRKCKEKKRASKRARGGERAGRIETRLDRREKHASWCILGRTQGGCHKLNGQALTVGVVDMLLPLLCYLNTLNYFVSVFDAAVVPSLVGTWCCAICIPGSRGVIVGPLRPVIGGKRDGIQIAAACTDNYINSQLSRGEASLAHSLGSGNDPSSWSHTESLSPCRAGASIAHVLDL